MAKKGATTQTKTIVKEKITGKGIPKKTVKTTTIKTTPKRAAAKKSTAKKTPVKKTTTRKTPVMRTYVAKTEIGMEKILIENFVALQKVMTHLSLRFDNLSTQISKLLELFELSAKSLAEKEAPIKRGIAENKEVINKIDNLFEQNKVIAKSLTLLHEPGAQPAPMPPAPQQPPMRTPQPLPTAAPQIPTQMPQKKKRLTGYQKSISTKPDEPDPEKEL